ncbi:CYTH domain-containing protein [Pseudotenacibaculum haliotis]|uniref:CYTH domain-containing protein n=1 Tax=Pseudotenacibaculum haliotis TaxID=1862138 RepID=A0ABW5LPD0_9FLAO
MGIEIERKFLVKNTSFKDLSFQKNYIKQGFLNSDKERVVRIRITDDTAFLTVKGVSNKSGTSRFEWEKEISKEEAQDLMQLCEPGIIEKYRYLHQVENHVFEIDVFLGANEGLILAEVEISNEDEQFISPSYLGDEVTGQEKYYNSNLSKNPFKNWA